MENNNYRIIFPHKENFSGYEVALEIICSLLEEAEPASGGGAAALGALVTDFLENGPIAQSVLDDDPLARLLRELDCRHLQYVVELFAAARNERHKDHAALHGEFRRRLSARRVTNFA